MLLLLILIFFGCKPEEKPVGNNPAYGKIKITVAKNVVPGLVIDSDLIKSNGDTLSVSLEGYYYKEPKNIPLTPENISDRRSIESLISNDHYANQLNNEEMILSNWSMNDQSTIGELLSDEEVRSQNKKFVRQITNLNLHAVLRYKGYYLALVEVLHNEFPYSSVFTITKSVDGYFLTNILSSDNVVHLVWTAFSGEGKIEFN